MVEQVACCDQNLVGRPPCEGFVRVFEFENPGHSLLEELGDMVVCNKAATSFVTLFRGSKDPHLLVQNLTEGNARLALLGVPFV